MKTEQPEALRREYRATMPPEVLHMWAADALACIASLEAQLEAIGAGGISPLIAGAGFDAADMATASAQGFRDGVASVSRLTDPQIASACMSYRHDFGLLDDAYKEQLVYDARSWEYAFAKEREWAAADGESNGN